MSGVPNVFGSATSSIPLSQLDVNFNTPVTIGNTTVGLGNTVTSFGNVTLTNTTISGLSGGSANGVVYINSSNVAVASPAVLTFDGTNLLVGTTNSSTTAGNGFKINPNGINTGITQIGIVGASSDNNYGTYSLYSSLAGQYQFYVGYGGTVYARSTSITGLSDQREKENIRALEVGLNEVLALQPRRFDWKDGFLSNVAGFIAQEVQQVLPDLVEEYKLNDEETRLGLKMGDMLPTMVKAIQELSAQVTALQTQVTALQAKVGV